MQSATDVEVKEALSGLTDIEWTRLLKYSRRRVLVLGRLAGGRNAREFVHDAMVKSLFGDRKWNKHNVGIVGHLMGIIRSDTSHLVESFGYEKNDEPFLQSERVTTDDEGNETDPIEQATVSILDPHFHSIDHGAVAKVGETVSLVRKYFEHDKEASQVLELLLGGMNGTQVQEELGISAKEYATVHRRIVRNGSKAIAGGSRDEG